MDPEHSQERLAETLIHELSILGHHNHLEWLSVTFDLPKYTLEMNQHDLQGLDAAISWDRFRSLKAVNIFINIVKVAIFSLKTFVSN